MNCLAVIVGVLCCVFVVGGGSITPLACDTTKSVAVISSLEVSQCNNSGCHFKKGTDIAMAVTFTYPDAILNATASIRACIPQISCFNRAPPNKDACLDMPCPTTANAPVTYKTSTNIPSFTPSVSVYIEFTLKFNGVVGLCFKVIAQVKD